MLLHYEYGNLPPTPKSVTAENETVRAAFDGKGLSVTVVTAGLDERPGRDSDLVGQRVESGLRHRELLRERARPSAPDPDLEDHSLTDELPF